MLKKCLFYLWIGFLAVICIYSIYLMYQNDSNYNISIEKEDISYESSNNETYSVKVGNVVKSINITGQIMPVYAEEQVKINIEGKSANIKKNVSVGDMIEKDTIFAEYNGNKYRAESKMCCIEITENEEGVSFVFLDYSKLYVEVGMPEKYISEMLCNKEVMISCNEENIKGNIEYIDYYCENGEVKTIIKYQNEEILLRPGSECMVNILIEEKKDVLAVPLQFIIYSETDNEFRVMSLEGDMTYTKNIEVGVIGNEMVEIISGINEDEVIMLPKDEMSLKYYLMNNQGEIE